MFLGIATDTWAMIGTMVVGLLAISYEWWLPKLQAGGGSIWDFFKTKTVTTPPVTTTTEDPDVLDLRAAKRLLLRFQNNKCQEGMQAMQVVFEHFFHGESA